MSWQRVPDDDERVHAFRLDGGRDWRLAAACGRGPATGLFVDPSFPECVDCVEELGRRSDGTGAAPTRADGVPRRREPRPEIASLLREARDAGVAVEELDADHVRLRYDATVREHWLAVDRLYDAVRHHSAVEGDGTFECAPLNWVVVHFDDAACGESRRPPSGPAP